LPRSPGAVEGHDRRRGDREQLVVQGDDLRPVGLLGYRSIRMHGVDGGLELIRTGLAAAKAPAEDRLSLLDQGPVSSSAVLLAEQHQGAVGRAVRDARRDSVRSSSASRPATSGSSGMSVARLRASRIAPEHRPGSAGLVSPAV